MSEHCLLFEVSFHFLVFGSFLEEYSSTDQLKNNQGVLLGVKQNF